MAYWSIFGQFSGNHFGGSSSYQGGSSAGWRQRAKGVSKASGSGRIARNLAFTMGLVRSGRQHVRPGIPFGTRRVIALAGYIVSIERNSELNEDWGLTVLLEFDNHDGR